jgi:hypothetical protein
VLTLGLDNLVAAELNAVDKGVALGLVPEDVGGLRVSVIQGVKALTIFGSAWLRRGRMVTPE